MISKQRKQAMRQRIKARVKQRLMKDIRTNRHKKLTVANFSVPEYATLHDNYTNDWYDFVKSLRKAYDLWFNDNYYALESGYFSKQKNILSDAELELINARADEVKGSGTELLDFLNDVLDNWDEYLENNEAIQALWGETDKATIEKGRDNVQTVLTLVSTVPTMIASIPTLFSDLDSYYETANDALYKVNQTSSKLTNVFNKVNTVMRVSSRWVG